MCNGLADIVLIVDSSGSINEVTENWPTVVQFLQRFVRARNISPVQTQIGLVQFSNNAFTIFKLDTYSNQNDVLRAINGMRFIGGRTNLAEALDLARTDVFEQRGNRLEAKDIAIVITDGIPNERIRDTIPAADRLKASGQGVTIVSVGVTNQIDENQLRAIASSPSDVILTPSFDTLNNEIDALTARACVTPAPPTPGGKTCFLAVSFCIEICPKVGRKISLHWRSILAHDSDVILSWELNLWFHFPQGAVSNVPLN